MITVSFYSRNGEVFKVRAAGHSGLAEYGSDVLCAAVSTLVQSAYLAIKDLGVPVTYDRDIKSGLFEFVIDIEKSDEAMRHDVGVIIRAAQVGLLDICSGFPKNIKTEVIKCL